MPLLKVETRSKSADARPPRPGVPAARPTASVMPAVAIGVFLGLVIIAGTAAFLVGRGAMGQPPSAAAVPQATAAMTQTLTKAGSGLPSADPSLPPINQDFGREAIVALVNGVPFSMGQLEVAVRIGRTLGTLAGDPVPDYTSQDMLKFQVQMLRRQVDVILMKQAFQANNLEDPGLPLGGLISSYLERVGATEDDLKARMAENGVTTEQLQAWFGDSQQANLFVAQVLMKDKDPAEREALTKAWLDEQWNTGEIYVTFYDPDSDVWSPPPGASDSSAASSEPSAEATAPLATGTATTP